jgi:XTP/dITP diphosphohydrolase
MKNKLVFVTQNKNKVIDAQKMLKNYEIEHIEFDVPEIQSLNIEEIASFKVKYAYEQTKTPCFVWDVGLFLECLNDFPGPLVKWYFTKTVGPEKTCKIANLFSQHTCRWTTVLAYYDGEQTHFVEETVFGTVPTEPRGENGYDWDVIFIPDGEKRTFAEMTYEEKAEFAVTKKLLSKFEDLLNNLDKK